MNFTSDLCTLGTLTESTLLCSVEQRRKDELTEVDAVMVAGWFTYGWLWCS